MTKRAYDDFAVGDVFDFGPKHVTRAEIIAFAAEFDPQPFHLDEQAPATALLGGLIASGWHVCAIFMRMLCDGLLLDSLCLGSPGVETLKWQRPVRPGDTVSGRSTVLDMRPSVSRPTRGLVRFRHEVMNQAGETVMWMENSVFFERRAKS
jgi:acyl dehydratase